MLIPDLVALGTAFIAVITVVFVFAVKFRFRSAGKKRLHEDLFMFPQIGGFVSLSVLAYRYFISESLTENQSSLMVYLGAWALITSFAFPLLQVSRAIRRPVRLSEIEIPVESGSAPEGETVHGLAVAHLSDLHIPESATIEGSLDAADVVSAVGDALRWAAPQAHRLLLTGDITDTGSSAEWSTFWHICEDLGIDRTKIIIIPGNHDLSLELGFSPIVKNVNETYERRCYNFIRSVLLDCPATWHCLSGDKLVSIRRVLASRSAYFEAYEKHPPKVDVLPAKPSSVFYLRISDEAKKIAGEVADSTFPWPSAQHALMSELMELIYPMIFFYSEEFMIVGLNSSHHGAEGVLDGAFGNVGYDQRDRLAALLRVAGERQVLILVHHHLGVTDRVTDRFAQLGESIQLRFLRLSDAKNLLQVCDRRNVTIFHGHKHVAYEAMFGTTKIISAPSIAYGDHLAARSDFGVYILRLDGSMTVRRGGPLLGGRVVTSINSPQVHVLQNRGQQSL